MTCAKQLGSICAYTCLKESKGAFVDHACCGSVHKRVHDAVLSLLSCGGGGGEIGRQGVLVGLGGCEKLVEGGVDVFIFFFELLQVCECEERCVWGKGVEVGGMSRVRDGPR